MFVCVLSATIIFVLIYFLFFLGSGVTALNQTINVLTGKRERRRTSSMKLLQQQPSIDTRSNTPELKEV